MKVLFLISMIHWQCHMIFLVDYWVNIWKLSVKKNEYQHTIHHTGGISKKRVSRFYKPELLLCNREYFRVWKPCKRHLYKNMSWSSPWFSGAYCSGHYSLLSQAWNSAKKKAPLHKKYSKAHKKTGPQRHRRNDYGGSQKCGMAGGEAGDLFNHAQRIRRGALRSRWRPLYRVMM